MSKDELLAEAALILEQEGWLVVRQAHETGSHRLKKFAARYEVWRAKVAEARRLDPKVMWPEAPDNS